MARNNFYPLYNFSPRTKRGRFKQRLIGAIYWAIFLFSCANILPFDGAVAMAEIPLGRNKISEQNIGQSDYYLHTYDEKHAIDVVRHLFQIQTFPLDLILSARKSIKGGPEK